MKEIFKKIESIGVLPVIKIHNEGDSENLAASLLAGDLPAVEITFRTSAAEKSIRRIRKKFPGILLGAGTILTAEQADSAVSAGADFLVSPGFNPKVAEYCLDKDIPFIPGVDSPSQIEAAMEYGFEVLKFFPSEVLGGVKMLKSLSGPYPDVRFIPTGGVNIANLMDYLSLPQVVACGGSWIAPADMIKEGRFDDIAKLASAAVSTILGFRFSGVSLSPMDGDRAESVMDFFASTFLLAKGESESSYHVGSMVEIEKNGDPHRGKMIISVNSLFRTKAFFERKKISFADGLNDGEIFLPGPEGGFGIKIVEEHSK